MKVTKRWFLFYLNASVHVALAITALAVLTLLDIGAAPNVNFLLFLFFASISGYNFVKYAGVAPKHHLSQTPDLRLIRAFTLPCLAAVVGLTFLQPWPVVLAAACLAFITACYAVPAIRNKNLREVSGLKIFVIAAVWAGATVWLPLLSSNVFSWTSSQMWFTLIQRFFFVIALTLPFEIRDLKYDEPELFTVPQLLGIAGTKVLGVVLLAVVFGLQLFISGLSSSIPVLITVGVTGVAIVASRIHQPKYYAAFWVEGIPLLWIFLTWFFG